MNYITDLVVLARFRNLIKPMRPHVAVEVARSVVVGQYLLPMKLRT